MKLNTWGRCSVWLTGSSFQWISGFILWIRLQYVIIDSAVSSTTQSGYGINRLSLYFYVAPLPVIWRPTASSNIPDQIAPDWHVMYLDFSLLATNPYHRKSQVSILWDHWSHFKYHDLTRPPSAYNIPMHRPTASPSPSWETNLISTTRDSQLRITLSTTILNRVGYMRPT